MFAYLAGTVLDKQEKSLTLLAQSVGYKVFVTTDLLAKANEGSKMELYIHTAVREGDISLYGFTKREELTFFEQLMGVNGIGPKTALEILSAPLAMTQQAIAEGDTSMLTKIKGLGRKTAERLVLELKGKVVPVSLKKEAKGVGFRNEEAVLALVGLGYDRYQVLKTLSEMPENLEKTEDIVKYFLKKG